MLQARMATRVGKPNGQFWLRPDDVASFMLDKRVTDLPGQVEPVFFSRCIQLLICCLSLFVGRTADVKGPLSLLLEVQRFLKGGYHQATGSSLCS